MRRAIRFLAVALAGLALLPTAPKAGKQVNVMNAIGLIDYTRKPDFKVGDWVKYHVSGQSDMGMADDYDMTITIAGEEEFWGDPCFWVETLTENKNRPSDGMASLMSYDVFGDSLALVRNRLYLRKSISGFTEDGEPQVDIVRRPDAALRSRDEIRRDLSRYVDSLGTETITVPHGSYACTKVLLKQIGGNSIDVGDSSTYTEVREFRTIYVSRKVPITGLVREDIDYGIYRKTWLIGRSQNAPMFVMDHSEGRAELVDFGTGRVVDYIPARLRMSIADQKAQEARKARGGKRSGGRSG